MVFGALTLFCLVSFAAAAFNVGQVSSRRMAMQTAADHAALAGAHVEADLLSEIAWINEGMAYVYYNLMRHAVDVTCHGVLAELKQHGPVLPSDAVVGLADPVGTYDATYAVAAEWLDRGQDWIDHLEKLEDGITIAAPGLIREEIFRVARAMGADKVAIFPDLEFYPHPDSYLLLHIERLSNGWQITDNNGYLVQALILGPDSFQVTSSTSGSFTVTRPDPDHYVIQSASGTTTLTRTDLGWIVSGPAGSFSVTAGPHGGFVIDGGSSSGEYRRDANGNLQQWVGGAWTDLGSPSIVIDGVEVPIAQNSITVGNTRIDLEPLAIWIDNLSIVPTGSELVIQGHIGPAAIRIDDDYAVINGLSTQSADGKWRPWPGDRRRHRLTQTSADTWDYELVREGSVLQVEPNRERFGVVHAVRENDPGYLAGAGYPAWMHHAADNPSGWFDPRIGRIRDPYAYHQTRACWHPDDNLCPEHGTSCPGNGGGFTDVSCDGGWHVGGAWVDCPTCQGLDHDADGLTDVRKYQADTVDPASPTYRDPSWQSVALPLPFVLSETFFRYGINVGVWKDKATPLLGFPEPEWGVFAFSSARAGFLNPTTGLFTYGIADLNARSQWVSDDPANFYHLTEWEARLVPVRTAIRSDDIDADTAVDSGAAYLLRGFLETHWLETAEDRNPAWHVNAKLRQMRDKHGAAFDFLDRRFEDVVRH